MYSRGSEWSRWDFHIHTPGMLKNDQFIGLTLEEKWEKFYQDIKAYIGNKDNPQHKIVAMGVTDYLSIKNYQKIISDGIITDLIPFIFPNVELRITPIAQRAPINIHCLFNPKIAHELEGRFFAKLNFNRADSSFSAIESELIRFGKAIDSSLNDEEARKKAAEQFVVPYTDLQRIFNTDIDLRQNTIIAVSNKTSDGASGIANAEQNTDQQLYQIREELYRMSDLIFSANERDIRYFLGEKEPPEKILKKYNKLIPCVNGCDAHTNADIFEPAQKKYCWIKAIPSFEGLREIIFEPKERVKIQELKPEGKLGYYVIDKVEIEDENFSKDPIPFSENLTCIIGGKSTGKSLLLHNMAEAIDPRQVKAKLDITNGSYYKAEQVKVYWKDGTISRKDWDIERKIVYLPQTYLNKLSDANEEKTEIDDIIHEILMQNEEICTLYKAQEVAVEELKREVHSKIYDLIALNEKIKENKAIKLEKGETKSVELEIGKLKKKKEDLVRSNNISENDVENYDLLLKDVALSNATLKILEKDKISISSISTLFYIKKLPEDLSETKKALLLQIQEKLYDDLLKTWNQEKKILISSMDNEIQNVNLATSRLAEKIDLLKPKVENNTAIIQLTREISAEEKKLVELKALDEQIKKQQERIDDLIKEISHLVLSFYYKHEQYATAVNKRTDINSDDLEFKVTVPLRLVSFCNVITDFLDNRRKGLLFEKITNGDIDFNVGDFDESFIEKSFRLILNSATNGILKKGISVEDALNKIASDWYNITYTIRFDGDEIEKMSPGKKALVLLRLLINLAESKCPILIDQPEDDLDNRSIYNELVDFIRTKKVDRQIILVTHNANIVVGCDTEEVIVANQRGNNAKNNQYRFEYRTGAIEDTLPLYDKEGNIINGVLYQTGIQQHICEVLEGGKEAFNVRKKKYMVN